MRARNTAEWILVLVLVCGFGCSSKVTKPKDDIAPARVSDLRLAAVADSSVTLTWTAPGGNGTVGQASFYEFRYLDAPFSDQDWSAATQISPSPPVSPAGTVEHFTIKTLPLLQKSYVAFRTGDLAGNWSSMSNQVAVVPGPPRCTASPDTISFGQVPVGSSFDIDFTIANQGGGTLSGQIGQGCGPEFTVTEGGSSYALLGGQIRTVTVRFAPLSVGERSCVITLSGPCGGVLCDGVGIVEHEPAMIPLDVGAGATFFMGSPSSEAGRDDDEMRHQAKLTRSFLVCNREVTQGEWTRIMGWNESPERGADLPVTNVSWYDAVLYCNLRSAAEGLTRAYDLGDLSMTGNHITRAQVVPHPDSTGYRLLTEAEWEYACRAGAETAFTDGDISQTGCSPVDPNLDRAGWYCGNSGQVSHPTRGKAANSWRLYDLHGNVSEWCWDYYAAYPDSAVVVADYSGPDAGDSRVVRGGAFDSNAANCRCAFRLYHPPGNLYPDLGLRVARAG